MSKVDKQQLRELAEKATPGPWWIDSHGHRMSADGGSETVFIASEKMGEAKRHPETGNLSHWPNDWDASFIAASSPATVLALLDEIEALRKDAFPCLTGSVCGGDASLNTVNISSVELVKWSEVPLGTAVTVIIHRRDGGADRG